VERKGRGGEGKGREGRGREGKGQRGGLRHDAAQGLHQGKSGPVLHTLLISLLKHISVPKLILRAFVSRDINTFVRAYLADVRPSVEFNSIPWSPDTVKDIVALEGVQRRFTKKLPGLYRVQILLPR